MKFIMYFHMIHFNCILLNGDLYNIWMLKYVLIFKFYMQEQP